MRDLVYQLLSGYTPQSSIQFSVQITHDSDNTVPSTWTWTIQSTDGLATYYSSCQDDIHNCGTLLAADTTPPQSAIEVYWPKFIDPLGNIFIATTTPLLIFPDDPAISTAVNSGVAFIGLGIDANASSVSQLNSSTSSFVLPPGHHVLQYGAIDNAGNAESPETLSVTVVGNAPPPPINLVANGGNPSPWSASSGFSLSWQNSYDISGIKAAFVQIDGGQPESVGPAPPFIVDLGTSAAQGSTPVRVWLQDNVNIADPGTAATVNLRFDDVPPSSTAVSPSTTSATPIAVFFNASDPGSTDTPATGSGINYTLLWFRKDNNGDGNFGPWQTVTSSLTGTSGQFSFQPIGEGQYQFFTQSFDLANNSEASPTAASSPKTTAFYDPTPPTISSVSVPLVTYGNAEVQWTTDDLSTGYVEYGTSTAFGYRVPLNTLARSQLATLDCHLLSPATIYYRITAINVTQLQNQSAIRSLSRRRW